MTEPIAVYKRVLQRSQYMTESIALYKRVLQRSLHFYDRRISA